MKNRLNKLPCSEWHFIYFFFVLSPTYIGISCMYLLFCSNYITMYRDVWNHRFRYIFFYIFYEAGMDAINVACIQVHFTHYWLNIYKTEETLYSSMYVHIYQTSTFAVKTIYQSKTFFFLKQYSILCSIKP